MGSKRVVVIDAGPTVFTMCRVFQTLSSDAFLDERLVVLRNPLLAGLVRHRHSSDKP